MSRNPAELLRWWCQGKLEPLIAETFPLAEAGAALNALLSRRYAGKVVAGVKEQWARLPSRSEILRLALGAWRPSWSCCC
jgi:hypothetical protein